MENCIFSGHCFEYQQCDKACPTLAQTSYLLERNGLSMNSCVFRMGENLIQKYTKLLVPAKYPDSSIRTYIVDNGLATSQVADSITYCGICENWKGSQLHCVVYNLKLAQYIDAIQKSWNSGENQSVEYMKLWASEAKVLVISNFDYVNFKDFACQTFLSLLQEREARSNCITIVVSPPPSSLVGDGAFFAKLTDILMKTKVD